MKTQDIQLIMLIVGLGLVFYPEPATTATGLLLVLGSFGVAATQ